MEQTSSLREDGTFDSQKAVFNYFTANVLNGFLDALN